MNLQVADELAKRKLVDLVEHVAKLFVVVVARGKGNTVVLSQSADESIAVLLAYSAVLIPMPGI